MAHWTNEKIIKAWVDHNQRGGQTSFAAKDNISFRGPILFSFGAAIACYHTGRTHRMFVLFTRNTNRRKEGWRTSNHSSYARNAVGCPFFVVNDINIGNDTKIHEDNLVQMYADFKTLGDDCIKSFKHDEGRLSNGWLAAMRKAHEEITYYISCADIDADPGELERRLDHVRYERMKRWQNWMDPKAVAKRERAAARKLAKKLIFGMAA